jgi:hypothetical protein
MGDRSRPLAISRSAAQKRFQSLKYGVTTVRCLGEQPQAARGAACGKDSGIEGSAKTVNGQPRGSIGEGFTRSIGRLAPMKATGFLVGSALFLTACSQAINYTYSKKNFSSPTIEAACKHHKSPVMSYQQVPGSSSHSWMMRRSTIA